MGIVTLMSLPSSFFENCPLDLACPFRYRHLPLRDRAPGPRGDILCRGSDNIQHRGKEQPGLSAPGFAYKDQFSGSLCHPFPFHLLLPLLTPNKIFSHHLFS